MSNNEHLVPERVAAAVTNREHFSLRETHHVESCGTCRDWLMAFIELARHSNINVDLKVPPLRKPVSD